MSSSQDTSHLIVSGNRPGQRRRAALKDGAAPRTTGEAKWLDAFCLRESGAETHGVSRKFSPHSREEAAERRRSRSPVRSEQRDERRRSPVPRRDPRNRSERVKNEQRGRQARSPVPQEYPKNPFFLGEKAKQRRRQARSGLAPLTEWEETGGGILIRDLLTGCGDTRFLLDGGVPVAGMYEAGVSASELFRSGVSAAELLGAGVPVAELLKAGVSALALHEAGVPADTLTGLNTMDRPGSHEHHDKKERQAPEPAGNITGEANSNAIKTETDEADSTSIKKETDEAGSILTALRSVVVKIADVVSTFAA